MNNYLDALDIKERTFVLAYIKGFNATQAAVDALEVKSRTTAATYGSQMLKREDIKKAIAEQMEARAEKLKIDSEWVLKELLTLYNLSLGSLVNVGKTRIDPTTGETYTTAPYIDFTKSTPEQLAMLDSIQISRNEWGPNIKITKSQKLRILELIGKHVNVQAFKDKIELDTSITLNFDQQDSEA